MKGVKAIEAFPIQRFTQISEIRYCLLWILLAQFSFTVQAFAQSASEDEIRYKQMMDEILTSGKSDLVILKMLGDSLNNISYYNSNLPIEFAQVTIEKALQIGDIVKAGDLEHRLGVMYINLGEKQLAKEHTRRALGYFAKTHELKKKASAHGLMRYIFSISDGLDSSLYHCYQALEIYQGLNDEAGIGATYNDIAGTLINAQKFEEALVFADKGIPVLERNDERFEEVMIKDKKASCLFHLGRRTEALEILREAISRADTLNPKIQNITVANLLQSRARFYIVIPDYPAALADIQLADKYLWNNKSEYWRSVNKMAMADIYEKQKDYENAKRIHLNMLQEHSADTTENANAVKNTRRLAEIYSNMGAYDSAYYYLKWSNQLSTEKLTAESVQNMEALKTKYETEQKEKLIAVQETVIAQQKNVQLLSWSLSGLLIIGLMGTTWFFITNKRRKEALEILNTALDQRNLQNELLLKEIHHRVKNNLQIVSSLLNLQSDTIHDPAALDAVGDSQHRVRSMALIHQKLYLNENLASIEMMDYFETMGETILQSFGSRAALIEYHVEMEKLELDIDTAIPLGLITNELVTNSLKHAFPDGHKGNVTVGLRKSADNELVLSVSDDGVPDHNLTSNGSGFGTQLVQLLAAQLNGRIVKSIQHGTKIALHFPLPELQTS